MRALDGEESGLCRGCYGNHSTVLSRGVTQSICFSKRSAHSKEHGLQDKSGSTGPR